MSRVLVVEDSKSIREEICEILLFEGFEVIYAEDGLCGLEKARTVLPNLIISDISMPKLNGYQFLAELQQSSTTKSIPFIFLSGKTQLPDLRKGMNMGADDYLVKPFNVDDLLKVVKSKLKKQKVIQDSIDELVEENEYSLKEAGRMAKIGYWRYIKQTDTLIWSETIHDIYGTDPKNNIPDINSLFNFFAKKSRNKLEKAIKLLKTDGIPFDLELKITNAKNKKVWIRSIGELLYNSKNEIIGTRGVSQDITEQKKITNKIEKAEKMYRLLADHSKDLICLQESDSTFKYISPSIKTLLGYEQSEFIGKKAFNIIHKEDIDFLKKTVKERVSGKKLTEAYTLRVRHKGGHFIWLESITSPVYKGGKMNYFITSSRDVSQWMVAKQEIQEYQTSLQKLTTEISLIEEKQKKEIASNIHDHLSQSLVISKMRINELKKNSKLNEIDEDLKFIETHISEALKNSRKITYELSPPVLYQLGIIDALNWLLEEVESNHKIMCKLSSNVTSIKLSDGESILLYRSIQEIVNNTIKYANASLITLDFNKNKFGVDIHISDNGVGFNTSILNHNHNHSGSGFGLFTIQERIRNIKGKFTITSKISEGTNVTFFIPLSI